MGLIAVIAAMNGAATGYWIHGPPAPTILKMKLLTDLINEYRKERQQLPADLDEVFGWHVASKDPHAAGSLEWERKYYSDGWGHPLIYTHDATSFLLTSLGADGLPGGGGIDADFTSNQVLERSPSSTSAMTLGQFLSSKRSIQILIWCVINAVLSGWLCFSLLVPRQGSMLPIGCSLLGCLATLLGGTFFAFMIGILDIVKYH